MLDETARTGVPNRRTITRRDLLVLAGLGAAGLTTAATLRLNSTGDASVTSPSPRDGTAAARLIQPPLLRSANGRLELALVAAQGVNIAGRRTTAFGYNGTSPGPTLSVQPGDVLAISLTNKLDRPTNLHTHGLRVSRPATATTPSSA